MVSIRSEGTRTTSRTFSPGMVISLNPTAVSRSEALTAAIFTRRNEVFRAGKWTSVVPGWIVVSHEEPSENPRRARVTCRVPGYGRGGSVSDTSDRNLGAVKSTLIHDPTGLPNGPTSHAVLRSP